MNIYDLMIRHILVTRMATLQFAEFDPAKENWIAYIGWRNILRQMKLSKEDTEQCCLAFVVPLLISSSVV